MNYKNMELSITEKFSFYAVVLASGALMGWIFYDSFRIGVIIGIVAFSYEGEYRKYLIKERNQELLLQFRDFLYSLSSTASTGRSIRQGIIESYSFWKDTYLESDYIMIEMKSFIEKMEKSNTEDISLLEDFANRSGLEDIEDVAMVCRVCKRTGGNLSQALAKCNDVIGDKITLEKELRTVMKQKRFEGYIIAAAPVVLMLFMKLVSPEYLAPLTSTGEGRFVSTIALALIGAAWLLIERLNNIEI